MSRPLELNLPLDKYSHGLRKRSVAEARKQSYDEAVASVGSTTGGKVPKRQTQEVARRSVQDFDLFYSSYGAAAKRTTVVDPAIDLLILSFDGKGIVMMRIPLKSAT